MFTFPARSFQFPSISLSQIANYGRLPGHFVFPESEHRILRDYTTNLNHLLNTHELFLALSVPGKALIAHFTDVFLF
ncbi:hypothetical protein L596_016516 [Steinernema carpocapsae]|uniref:Uncharacterized protein n=1 Tax=Steinernema carpocapsae TaxID=34508 RepID=A0A4U5NJD0_STECR|nr:hypothetical protein L596_016516 [Steinernema carpocapsae]